jgi:hypothetical protein
VQRAGRTALWPGFAPERTPLAIWAGAKTWLFRHPSPPPDYQQLLTGLAARDGRDPSVTANTSAVIGGISTATLMLTPTPARTAAQWAAVAVHEAFHVYERARHPAWAGNEAELFTYPVENRALLVLRLREDVCLMNALRATSHAARARWTRAALDLRDSRLASTPASAAQYERASELNEGLAQYVERRFLQVPDSAVMRIDFAASDVRRRAYFTGEALARLLDSFLPGWKAELEAHDDRWLDQLLLNAPIVHRAAPAPLTAARQQQLEAQADLLLKRLVAQRAAARAAFAALAGWRVVIEAGSAPLLPTGFDPLNVQRLDATSVLHSRFLKLGIGGASLEMLGHEALTEAAGDHPLFSGVRRATIAGLAERPQVVTGGSAVTLSAEGLAISGEGEAKVDEAAQTVTVVLSGTK